MKFVVGKFYRTRNGLKAKVVDDQYKLDNSMIDHLLCILYDKKSEANSVMAVGLDGYVNSIDKENQLDLVEEWTESIRICGWVNVYADGVACGLYSTREEADSVCSGSVFGYVRTCCVFVTGESD